MTVPRLDQATWAGDGLDWQSLQPTALPLLVRELLSGHWASYLLKCAEKVAVSMTSDGRHSELLARLDKIGRRQDAAESQIEALEQRVCREISSLRDATAEDIESIQVDIHKLKRRTR